jgi:hypothetical protein
MNIKPVESSIEAENAIKQIHDELKSRAFLDSLQENRMVDDTREFLDAPKEALAVQQTLTIEEFLNDSANSN